MGVVARAELELTTYEDDPEATAVKLFDIGKTDFKIMDDGGLDIRFVRKVRIKILKEAGIEHSEIKLHYYADGYGKTEKFNSIEATSINYENNQIVKTELDKKLIYDEKVNEYYNAKVFAIPNVKVGTIIEYTFEKSTPFVRRLPIWEFQSDIPTIYSHYTIKMVPFYDYSFISQGLATSPLVNSYVDKSDRFFAGLEFNDMVYEFELKNIPAFYDDEFITSRNDYIKRIRFELAKIKYPTGGTKELLSTWANVSGDLLRHDSFGRYIKGAEKYASKTILPQLDLNGKTDLEKIELLRAYVNDNYSLNGYYGMYADEKLKVFEKEKTGNVGGINLYLVGLLQAAGFNVAPVVLSTRANGKVFKDYPFSTSFNYVVAMVEYDEKLIFLDATEPFLPFYLLPTRCLNGSGLTIEEKPGWVELESSRYSSIDQITYAEFENDSLTMGIRCISDGYDAYKERIGYRKDDDRYFESQITDNARLIADTESVDNLDAHEQPFTAKYNVRKAVDQFESEYYILPFYELEYSKNPLTRNKRDYPVDLVYLRNRNFNATFKIPEGFTATSIPQSVKFDDKLMTFDYSVKNTGNAVTITANYKFKKAVIEPHEYNLLKYDFKRLHKNLTQQIVLKKATTE